LSSAALETRPYIGLRYFTEADAHLFYGRDEHVAELLAKVAQNRFVAVMGSSGCGKSSLVRAGLLPELRSGMIPVAGPRWKVVQFNPGGAPLRELANAIRSELGVDDAESLVQEGPLGIARAVAEAKLDPGTNVLVIADQFEEVFRYQREEFTRGRGAEAAEHCQALTRRLLDAAAQPELPIYVLLVMRSDYLGECAQFPDLPERMSQSLYLVPRLRRDQLQQAITAPVGGTIEPAVVQRLLAEVGSDPDQLPRLQHLLGRMWDRAHGNPLSMDQYADAGGWEKALEQHLEEVYARLTGHQPAVCARVFRQLSELDKGRAVRRRAEIGELIEVCGQDAIGIVRMFRAEGFVTPRENPVDITHECILREWPRLREWLEREDRSARRLRQLAEAAADAGWRPGLTPEQQKSVRALAGLTLQNLAGWRDETQPTAAWASRYLPAADFETAAGYLNWSELREQDEKRQELRLTRLFRALAVGFVAVLLLLTMQSLYSYRRARREASQAHQREAAAVSYAMGLKMKAAQGSEAAVPFYKQAIEHDPEFAEAYVALGAAYGELGENTLAKESSRKAYELREHVSSQSERFHIEGDYYYSVTGEMEKANQTYLDWIQFYPDDFRPHEDLAANYADMGQYAKAVEEEKAVLQLQPNNVNAFTALMGDYVALDQPEKANDTFEQARKRKLDHKDLGLSRYYSAFLQGDAGTMQEQLESAMGRPGAEDELFSAQADTEAFYGRLDQARNFTDRAVHSAQRAETPETAAGWKANAALYEAEVGNKVQARAIAADALTMSRGRDVEAQVALALARAGEIAEAEKLAAQLDAEFPRNTIVQNYWLPVVRAAVELQKSNAAKAIALLEVTIPYELGGGTDGHMYPAYLRGEAYLKLGRGHEAASEFQKLLDHRGVVLNFVTGSLARLQLARAAALSGDTASARRLYGEFLALWKDADTDLPVLKAAQSEYRKLR